MVSRFDRQSKAFQRDHHVEQGFDDVRTSRWVGGGSSQFVGRSQNVAFKWRGLEKEAKDHGATIHGVVEMSGLTYRCQRIIREGVCRDV